MQQQTFFFPENYQPTSSDIMCGRGRVFETYEGNKRFARAVRDTLPKYIQAEKRIDKSIVVASLVTSLHDQGMRFIKHDKATQRYFELSSDQAHSKTGHAIRDLLKNTSNNSKTKRSPKCKKLPRKATASRKQASIHRTESIQSTRQQQELPTQQSANIERCELQRGFTPNNIFGPTIARSSAIMSEGTLDNLIFEAFESQNVAKSETEIPNMSAYAPSTTNVPSKSNFQVTRKRRSTLTPLSLSMETSFASKDIGKLFEILSISSENSI